MNRNRNRISLKTLLFIVGIIILFLFALALLSKDKQDNSVPVKEDEEVKEEYGYVEINQGEYEKYLIVGNSYDLVYGIRKYGTVNEDELITSSNEKIAIAVDGKVVALSSGEVTIKVSIMDKEINYNYVVTDLIQNMPEEFDVEKELLACGRYTEEENDLLDEILEYRINNAGYASRGAVVACTRFLLLEFPYRLTYFYEWGRNFDKVDGEGRYYLKGLYLDESRYSRLVGSNTGPQTWGCPLYSQNIKATDPNGLDCSGFVTWVLYNAGFDCGDIGSGFSQFYDLTETGEMVKNSVKTQAELKAGDLVHSNYMGGHIGIVIGFDEDSFYVAQATPYKGWGVTVTKYDSASFIKNWQEIILMDSYYQQEGIYTNMW